MDRPTKEEHKKILRVIVPKMETIAYSQLFFACDFIAKVFIDSLLSEMFQISLVDIIFIVTFGAVGLRYLLTMYSIKNNDYLISRGMCDKTLSNNKRVVYTDFSEGTTRRHILCTTKGEKKSDLTGRECLLVKAIPGMPGHYLVAIKNEI